jgi:hypothetical protein
VHNQLAGAVNLALDNGESLNTWTLKRLRLEAKKICDARGGMGDMPQTWIYDSVVVDIFDSSSNVRNTTHCLRTAPPNSLSAWSAG